MRRFPDPVKRPRHGRLWLLVALGAALWSVALIPSGIDVAELLIFTAPAAALGVFMRWLSCAFMRSRWNWTMALRAALVSAMLMPPALASLVTLAGLQRPQQLLLMFVLGAWLALSVGLIAGALTFTKGGTTSAATEENAPPR